MRAFTLKPINREFIVSYLRDCELIDYNCSSTRKEYVESHINHALAGNGNAVIFKHKTKPTIKIHIIKCIIENGIKIPLVQIETETEKGKTLSDTQRIADWKVFDLFGENEDEIIEENTKHLESVLVV